MIAYLDTSVLLQIVLGQRPELVEWDQLVEAIVNPLVEVECLRTLDRLRFTSEISEEDLAAMPLGTLDGLHLASALIYRDSQLPDNPPIRFATHDIALARAARAMGLRVIGA